MGRRNRERVAKILEGEVPSRSRRFRLKTIQVNEKEQEMLMQILNSVNIPGNIAEQFVELKRKVAQASDGQGPVGEA